MGWERRTLGRTGREVARLGLTAGYGFKMTEVGIERMVEEGGVNYLYWGSMRWPVFGRALRNLKPKRDKLTLLLQSYTRVASLMEGSLTRALKRCAYDYADIVLLGFWNGDAGVSERIYEAALKLRDKGLVKYIAVSSHNRPLVARLAKQGLYDIIHFRYNAAHPGAETDIFPCLPAADERPGMVSFTATSWAQLLNPRKTPAGEKTPTAVDCYRFVLSNPNVDLCLTGPSNDAQAMASLEALRLGPMSADELAWMKRVGKAVHG